MKGQTMNQSDDAQGWSGSVHECLKFNNILQVTAYLMRIEDTLDTISSAAREEGNLSLCNAIGYCAGDLEVVRKAVEELWQSKRKAGAVS